MSDPELSEVEVLQESLKQIVRAATFVVAVAKQERHNLIRLDSMEKALSQWDEVRAKYYPTPNVDY